MSLIPLPYGKSHIDVSIPDNCLQGILTIGCSMEGESISNSLTQEEIVRRSMLEPIGSPTLGQLSVGKNNVVIIASDHTRPVPSKVIIPLMLDEIREANPGVRIRILISTGCHRKTSLEELRDKFGEEILKKEEIIIHDCDDEKNLVYLGKLPSGGDLVLNRIAAEADLLLAEGFIEPHFFAGFSGGRKSVLPGIAGRVTVHANHCSAFIADANARAGVLDGNPIHRDMIFAAEKIGLSYIVNVVLDSNKKIIHAVSGNFDSAHRAGASFANKYFSVGKHEADIVLTTNGGYPLDQNIYQCVKGMSTAEIACKKDGVIIIAAACEDGHGGQSFYDTFTANRSLDEIMKGFLNTGQNDTALDQWQSQIFARILMKHTVIMVTNAPEEMVVNMRMKYAKSVEEAINIAKNLLSKEDAKVLVIPDGVSAIIG